MTTRKVERRALLGLWVLGRGSEGRGIGMEREEKGMRMRKAGRRCTRSTTGNEMDGVLVVGRLIIVWRRIGGIWLMGFMMDGDGFESAERYELGERECILEVSQILSILDNGISQTINEEICGS